MGNVGVSYHVKTWRTDFEWLRQRGGVQVDVSEKYRLESCDRSIVRKAIYVRSFTSQPAYRGPAGSNLLHFSIHSFIPLLSA